MDVNERVLRGVHGGVGGAIRRVDHLLRGTVLLITVHDLCHRPSLRDKVHLGEKKTQILY